MVAKHDLTRKDLTIKQKTTLEAYLSGKSVYDIASDLKITRQAVEKHLRACQKKGWLHMVAQKRVASPPATYLWRIHGLHFLVRPYYFTDKYQKNLKKLGGFNIRYSNWRIILHRNQIELRQIAGHEYVGKTQDEVYERMIEAFSRDLLRIEQIYGFRSEKQRKQSVRLCRIHLVKGNSPISKNTKEHMAFYNKLGERFLLVDKSKGGFDHEGVHADTHRLDMENIENMLQDYSDQSSPRPQEVWQILSAIIKYQKDAQALHRDTAATLNIIVKMLQPVSNEVKDTGKTDYIL